LEESLGALAEGRDRTQSSDDDSSQLHALNSLRSLL
jgi:hypothetical protein